MFPSREASWCCPQVVDKLEAFTVSRLQILVVAVEQPGQAA